MYAVGFWGIGVNTVPIKKASPYLVGEARLVYKSIGYLYKTFLTALITSS